MCSNDGSGWFLDAAFFEGVGVEGKEQALSIKVATWLKAEILALQFTFFH